MKQNDAQRIATQAIDHNMALIAGAGTGKTKVLTDRFIYTLKHGTFNNPNRIDGIVAITFTKKAASEMQSRIQQAIRQDFPTDTWNTLLAAPLRISTIHSFCGDLLRAYPFEAGVDPQFESWDDAQSNQALYYAFETAFFNLEKEPRWQAVIQQYDWSNYQYKIQEFTKIYQKLRASGDTIAQAKDFSTVPLELSEEECAIVDGFFLDCDNNKRLKNFKAFTEDYPNWRDDLHGGMDEQQFDALMYAISRPLKKAPEVKFMIYRLQAKVKPYDPELQDFYFALLEEGHRLYKAHKKTENALDFDDLQEKALALFDSPIGDTLKEDIDYLLVDECQDINGLQRDLFLAICSKAQPLDRKNLFIVGDPRQSIYGFRYADVTLFHGLVEMITQSGGKTLTMDLNYRSTKTILDYVEKIFLSHFNEAPVRSANEKLHDKEIVWIDKSDDYTEEEAIVAAVQGAIASGVFPKDIMVLFRSKSRMQIVENALKSVGIPCVNRASTGFWKRTEITDIQSAFRVIGRGKDLEWLAFLRSPMVHWSDDAIVRLMQQTGDTIEEKMASLKFVQDDAHDVRRRVLVWRDIKHRVDLVHLFDILMSDTQYLEKLAHGQESERQLSNVHALREWVIDMLKQGITTLPKLLKKWDALVASEQEEAFSGSTATGAVELMTIHKSKGLGRRVVIVAGMDAHPNRMTDTYYYDHEYGLTARGSAKHQLAVQRQKEMDEQEELRVLYVALTRAKEYLIMTNHSGKNMNFRKILEHAGGLENLASKCKFTPEDTQPPRDCPREPVTKREIIHQIRPFSATQYKVFEQCPRQWYYRYVRELEVFDNEDALMEDHRQPDEEPRNYAFNPATRGVLFHALAEQTPTDPESALVAHAQQLGIDLPSDERDKLLRWYVQYANHDIPGKQYHEWTFDWKEEGYLWTGSIDLLVDDGVDLIIYDFKTNKSRENLEEKYKFQMQFYAMAIEKAYGKRPTKAVLWWIPEDEHIEIALDDADSDTREKMLWFATESHRILKERCVPECGTCESHCPFKTTCLSQTELGVE